MSSLPLISHHLFVAAAGHQDSNNTVETSTSDLAGSSNAVPLEVLAWTEPLADVEAVPVLAASSLGGA
jgi:hypothetical protein